MLVVMASTLLPDPHGHCDRLAEGPPEAEQLAPEDAAQPRSA